jgi:hypothetical protein
MGRYCFVPLSFIFFAEIFLFSSVLAPVTQILHYPCCYLLMVFCVFLPLFLSFYFLLWRGHTVYMQSNREFYNVERIREEGLAWCLVSSSLKLQKGLSWLHDWLHGLIGWSNYICLQRGSCSPCFPRHVFRILSF